MARVGMVDTMGSSSDRLDGRGVGGDEVNAGRIRDAGSYETKNTASVKWEQASVTPRGIAVERGTDLSTLQRPCGP